jgi:hypothetical protein
LPEAMSSRASSTVANGVVSVLNFGHLRGASGPAS